MQDCTKVQVEVRLLQNRSNSWSRSDGRVTMKDGFQFFLLGVNSSTAQLPEDTEPLGLNGAVFASIVQSITR